MHYFLHCALSHRHFTHRPALSALLGWSTSLVIRCEISLSDNTLSAVNAHIFHSLHISVVLYQTIANQMCSSNEWPSCDCRPVVAVVDLSWRKY